MAEQSTASRERVTEFLRRTAPHSGHVYLQECQVCGWLNWSSTDPGKPAGCTVEPAMDYCPRCSTAQSRAPEVVAWVFGVVNKMREDAAAKAETGGQHD